MFKLKICVEHWMISRPESLRQTLILISFFPPTQILLIHPPEAKIFADPCDTKVVRGFVVIHDGCILMPDRFHTLVWFICKLSP